MKNITYDRESVRKPLLNEMTILNGEFKNFMREWKKQLAARKQEAAENERKAVQAIAKNQ